jgi:hypothetical protein
VNRRLLLAPFAALLLALPAKGAERVSIAVLPPSGDAGLELLASAHDDLRRACDERGFAQPSVDAVRAATQDESLSSDPRKLAPRLGVDLLLVLRAGLAADGIDLEIRFVKKDGGEVCVESRHASRASALPQLRAMAGQALDGVASGSCPEMRKPAVAVASAKTGEPPPPDRTTALILSLVPTAGGTAIGFGLAFGTFEKGSVAFGFALAGLTLSVGPSLGHFYAGDTFYGLIGTGGRALHFAAGMTLVWFGRSFLHSTEYCDPNCDGGSENLMFIGGLTLSVLGTAWAIVDFVLAPYAVKDPEIEKTGKSKTEISLFPVAWPAPSGGTAYGLAVVSEF